VRDVHDVRPAWSISALCHLLDVPRSSYYFESERTHETALRSAISETAGSWPRYGSERITAQLHRDGILFEGKPVGERRVRRLMHDLGLAAKPHPRKVRTTDSTHSLPRYHNLVKELPSITHPDHVWVSDITYIALGSGFVYLAVLMDVYTRSIRGWSLSRQIDGALTLTALRKALASNRAPDIHHSDQGGQYAAIDYVAELTAHGVRVSMAAVGCPEENGYAERLMRTIKEEHVSLTEYRDFADASRQIGQFVEEVYQKKRIHSCLGYLTPAEFEAATGSEPRGTEK
jgi:putative transposase